MIPLRLSIWLQSVLTRLGLDSTIARNSVFLMGAEVLSRGINLALNVLLYRYLAPEGAGLMRFVMSYGVLLALLTELGITRAAVLQVTRGSRDDLPSILGHVGALRAILVAGFLAVTALSLFTPLGQPLEPQTKLLIWIWSCGMAAQGFRRNADVAFHGTQRMLPAGLLMLFNRILAAAAIGAAVLFNWGILGVFLAYFTADLMESLVAGQVIRRRFVRPNYRISRSGLAALFIAGIPFGIHLVSSQIYYYIDTVLIKYLFSADPAAVKREIGYYSNAYQIVLTLMFIPITLCNTMFAPLARAFHESDTARLRSLFNYGFLLLLLLGGPLAMAFFLLRGEFIITLFGADYRPAVPMLAVVIWTLPLLFLSAPVSNFLAATGRQVAVTICAGASAVFNIGVNWWLIPRLGGLGAAIATSATEAFSLLLLLAFAMRINRAVFDLRRLGWTIALQFCAMAFLVAFDRTAPSAGIRIAVYLLYAAGCAAALGIVVRNRRLANLAGDLEKPVTPIPD